MYPLWRSDEKRASARGRPIIAPRSGPHTPPDISFAYRFGRARKSKSVIRNSTNSVHSALRCIIDSTWGARLGRETYYTFSLSPTQQQKLQCGGLTLFLLPRIRNMAASLYRVANSTFAVSHPLFAPSLSLSLTHFARAGTLVATVHKDGRSAVASS